MQQLAGSRTLSVPMCLLERLLLRRYAPSSGRWVKLLGDLASLGNSGYNTVVFDVVCVVGLDISGKTVQGTLESILGRRVHHARLSLSGQLGPIFPTSNADSRIVAHHLAPMR